MVAVQQAPAAQLIYGPRDDCPGCGESLFDTEAIQLLDCHVGTTTPSWTIYHCPLCQTTFKVWWPSWELTVEQAMRIMREETERRARGGKP